MAEVVGIKRDDYEELCDFLVQFPDETRSRDYWMTRLQSWWEENPAFSEELDRGWALAHGGRIVGFLGNIPSWFQVAGKPLRVHSATTWRVLPAYRNESLRLAFAQASRLKHQLLFDATPKKEVEGVLRAMQFVRLPDAPPLASIIVGNWQRTAEARLGRGPWVRTVAALTAPFLKAARSIRLAGLGRQGEKTARTLDRADAAFDALWERTRGRMPNTNVRTSSALGWYCFRNRSYEKILMGVYQEDRLCGYGVCCIINGPKLRRMEFADLWLEEESPAIVGALLAHARREMGCRSADILLVPRYTPGVATVLDGLGLLKLRWSVPGRFVKGPRHLVAELLPERTYLVVAQGDMGL